MMKSPKTWHRYRTAGGLVVASVALGATAAAAAPAIAATTSPSATPSTTPSAGPGDEAPTAGDQAPPAGDLAPPAGDRGPGRGGPGARPATAASVIGVTEVELRTQLEAGKTLAQVAATKDISKATLISRLVAAEKSAIAADVKAGRITQDEADTRVAALQAKVTTQVDQVRPAGGPGGPDGRGGPAGGPGRGGPGARPATAASVIGVTEVELRTQLEAGKTLAQVAATKDISKATLISKLVAAEKSAIAADVKAGRITQDEADTRVAALQAKVTTQVDQVRPVGGPGGPDGRGGPAGGPGKGGPGARPATAASVIGVTEVELRTQLEAGKTLAQVAATKDISKATLISKLVAAEKSAIAADVKAGRITQDEAATRVAALQAKVTTQVDEVRIGRVGSTGSSPTSVPTPSASAAA